ncbi:MAG TPA: ribosome small subunit-dependent GTPase A [Caldilineaceae bacterium]|nr:ribosome small subunit-dependent GTPase A [Caldilineaceae bacterium]
MSETKKLSDALARKVNNHTKQMNKSVRRKQLQAANKKAKRGGKEKRVRQKQWQTTNLDITNLDDPDLWAEFDELEEQGYAGNERIMPVGEQERKRTLEKTLFRKREAGKAENDADRENDDALLEETVAGRVVEVSSNLCRVATEAGMGTGTGTGTLLCTIRQSLRELETGFTNVVAVGDEVRVLELDAENGVVEQVLPRRTVLARPDVFYGHLRQILVANADQLLIIAAWREPAIWFELIDRYLIAAERAQLPAVLCVNKIDLAVDRAECAAALQPYHDLNIPVLLTSAESGEGLPALRELLAGQVSVLAGLSGVGKSSLLSVAEPGLNLRVAEVSDRKHEGRHTTTQSSWHPLAAGGAVVDTPGIRDFGLAGLYKSELAGFFPEIAAKTTTCRFRNCTHINEAGCGVVAAVRRGEIAESRYHSYECIYPTLA